MVSNVFSTVTRHPTTALSLNDLRHLPITHQVRECSQTLESPFLLRMGGLCKANGDLEMGFTGVFRRFRWVVGDNLFANCSGCQYFPSVLAVFIYYFYTQALGCVQHSQKQAAFLPSACFLSTYQKSIKILCFGREKGTQDLMDF